MPKTLGQATPRFPPAAELWLTLLFRDSLVTAAQREGPSLTPSWSSLMDAVAWEMVRELLGVGKSHPQARRHPVRGPSQSFSLRGGQGGEEYGSPARASSLVPSFHIGGYREGITKIRS